MKRIGLVTCRTLPEPDPDEALLLDALERSGIGAELLPWDDPAAEAGRFDACVLRSCWNYHEAPDDFRAWLARAEAGTQLINTGDIVRWNMHKRYLQELEKAGLPIIPTAWFERGTAAGLAETMRDREWSNVVVKPAVSAASFLTRRFDATDLDEGESFLRRMLEERDGMVQLYMSSVETSGEKAVVWIDGEITHAVRKSPRFEGGVESVSDALPVSEAERRLAERAIAFLEEPPLYARVDFVRDTGGRPVISELELIEPSLFLKQSAKALERFAGALGRTVGQSVGGSSHG